MFTDLLVPRGPRAPSCVNRHHFITLFPAPLLALFILLVFAASEAAAVTIDTVPVANPGNGKNTPGFGQVSYNYRIGTYEVTNAQYAAFLNAKAASDPLELYNIGMGTEISGGISRSGLSGGFTYSVRPDMGNKPVNFVSWYDSIRFTNWLNNGQANGDTENGAYTLLGGTPVPSNGLGVARNSGATWFLPTLNEWYKAAYFDPRLEAQGGPPGNDHYWLYPTASDTLPSMASAIDVVGPTRGDIGNPGANVANYNFGADWNGQDGNVTSVGSAGPLSASYYGTLDQGGNVWEWNDERFDLGEPGLRYIGGSNFRNDNPVLSMAAVWGDNSYGVVIGSFRELDRIGFRVATVPEPSSFILAALGLIGLAAYGRRKRRLKMLDPL